MKNTTIIGTMLLSILFVILGCKKEGDTYTIEITNPFGFDIELGGGGHGLCANQGEGCKVIAPGQSRTYSDKVYDSGNHQVTLYSTRVGDNTLLKPSTAYFFPESGGEYAWTAGETEVRHISSGDQGGAGCSINNYNGPEFDIQIDGQCKAAFIYKCQGNEAGVRAACEIYRSWQQHQSGIPNCPYCN